MAWWSVSNMLHAFASSAAQLSFFRLLLGIGEPGNFMAAAKATSEWYPPKERAFVNGLVNAGASVGAIIAAPFVVWLYLSFGWRAAFVITGATGFFWLIAWLVLYRLPENHPWITAPELTLLRQSFSAEAAAAGAARRPRYLDLFRLPQTWGLFLSRFLSDPVWWFYLFWLPKYLVEHRGFSMVEVGLLAWMPYLSADIGAIFGGVLSGWLVKRQWPVLKARSAGMLPFALMMPLSIGVAFTPSSSVALALICIVTFAHMAWKTNLMTLTNDLYPRAVVGSVAGIAAFGNGLGGALFTGLTGFVVERFSYDAIFILMGFMHPAAFLLFRLFVKGPVDASRFRATQEVS
jgi:ACS family hexuronate transporter-like MFS transporter